MRPLAAASKRMLMVDLGGYFVEGSGWLLVFPGGLRMVAVISW